MRYYYTYEIYINDSSSIWDKHYYYGKHTTTDLNDDYYGSGKIIRQYIKKHGTKNLEKKILNYYTSLDELNKAEIDLITSKKAELKEHCLNILDGGDGGWDYVNNNCLNGNNYPRTKESRHYNAMAGGMGNKNRLENEEELRKWKLKCSEVHKNRNQDDKNKMYQKVSDSLINYYKTPEGIKEKEIRNKKNKQTNIETAKKWREEFYTLFSSTPESFRKYKKQKEVIELYKQIKELSPNEQQEKIKIFLSSIDK